MSITDLMGLKSEQFSFEGKLTSVILSDSGGTLTGKGDATRYGTVFITYHLTVNPNVPGQGTMTGTGTGIDDEGNLVTASLNGVFDRNGHKRFVLLNLKTKSRPQRVIHSLVPY